MLEIKNLSSGYGKKEILKKINVSFKKGELISVIGANGCGKTTLLKTIASIIKAREGEILIEGKAPKSQKEIARKISYLPQGKNTPNMTVGELVLHGRFPYLDYPRRYSERDREIARYSMKKMGIDHLSDTLLSCLSGGFKQKAYIAMALCQEGDFILLDEPVTYLDISCQLELMKILKAIAESGKCIIAVMHDLPLAFNCSDKIILMKDGEILLDASPQALYSSDKLKEALGVSLVKINEKYYYDLR